MTTRRRFVLGTIGIGAAVSVRPGIVLPDSRKMTAAGRLAATLSDQSSARSLGAVYLRVSPREANLRRLVGMVAARLPSGAVRRSSRDELRQQISAAVHDDFTAGRTVQVDGWVMSHTEARLCAIAALV